MHYDQLAAYRRISQALDVYLTRTFREITQEGPGIELQHLLNALLPGEGLYLDIGANDPIQISNTWPLYRRGWSGLLVEPDPLCWQRLLQKRPRDWLWPAAFSDKNGQAVLRASMSGVSSVEADWPCPPDAVERIVDLTIGAEVLDEFWVVRDQARLCSIDVEGHEPAVLRGLDLTRFRPEVFLVESLRYDPDESRTHLWPLWEPLLLAADYEFRYQTRDGVNRLYTRKGSDAGRIADDKIRAHGPLGQPDLPV